MAFGENKRRSIVRAAVGVLGAAGLLAFLAILLIAGDRFALRGLAHAQSEPSISISLAPAGSVPKDTEITATITLNGLDLNDYSSVIFRADLTKYGPPKFSEEASCRGDDTGRDIEVPVDESREVFTISVHKACPHHIYIHYTLDTKILMPVSRVEVASASTRFSMSRYLMAGVPTARPPASEAQAWLDPDPTTFTMYVGEWHEFRSRSCCWSTIPS